MRSVRSEIRGSGPDGSDVEVDQRLVELLTAAPLHGFMRTGVVGHLLQGEFTLLESLTLARIVGGITLFDHLFIGRVVKDVGRNQQRTGHRIHARDVGDEEVLGIRGIAARLGVEVRAAALQAPAAQDHQHGLNQFVEVDRELIRIPTILVVASVGVDRAEHPGVDGALQFVFERMAGQRGVVHLDVDLEVLVQPVSAQEADYRLCIDVILVLHRLHGFRLDKERSLETLRTGVVARHAQHRGHVLLLALHVGVQQRHVALAAAPEDVAVAAQLDRRVDGVLDLQHRACRSVEIGIRRGAVHVAGVPEDVGRTPQQLDARLGLLLLGVGDNLLQILFVLLGRGGFVHQVHVVEAVVLDAHLLHELEAGIHLRLGTLQRAGRLVPRELLRTAAELVAALSAERMPPRHREAEPILHLAAAHDTLRIVIVECHRVFRILALEGNLPDRREITFCCHLLLCFIDYTYSLSFDFTAATQAW